MSEVEKLTERIQFLEQQMRDLWGAPRVSGSLPGWKRKIGLFAGDTAFAEIVRLGNEIRKSDGPTKSRARSATRKKPGRSSAGLNGTR